MTAAEFAEWQAYYKLDPFGSWRADYQAGIVAAAVVNSRAFRPRSDRGRAPDEFIPTFEPKPKQTWQEQREIFKMWAAVWSDRGKD